jgi:hypothetical protein
VNKFSFSCFWNQTINHHQGTLSFSFCCGRCKLSSTIIIVFGSMAETKIGLFERIQICIFFNLLKYEIAQNIAGH